MSSVFASYAEFIAHHENLSLKRAEQMLEYMSPSRCCAIEIRKAKQVGTINIQEKVAT